MQEKLKSLHKAKNYQMPKNFHIEISRNDKNVLVSVFGVISVISIDNEKCVFKVRGGKIGIRGTALAVSVFENRILEVKGMIEGVELI